MSGQPPELLRLSAWWRLAGLLLERPRPGWSEEVRSLAGEVDDAALVAAAGDAGRADEGTYLRLLGPGGAVPAREVAYRGLQDPGRILAALCGLYDAFGYRPDGEDPADHIAVECGFAGFLALKEAWAGATGAGKEAGRVVRGREIFLREHLAPFAAALAERLETANSPGLQLRTARLVAARTRTYREPDRGLPGAGPSLEEAGAAGCGDSCPVAPPRR